MRHVDVFVARDLLQEHSQIGKSVGKHDQGDKEHTYRLGVVEDEVFVINEDFDPYKTVIQKIKKEDDSYIYRVCYFVITGPPYPVRAGRAPLI